MKKSVVITGASSGIGAALALRYAGEGVHLGLVGQNRERLESVAARCRALGARVQIGLIDVTRRKDLADWLLEFDRVAPIDLLFANAGVLSGIEPGEVAEDAEASRRLFDINVGGVLNTVEPVLPHMVLRHHGCIAIMSSVAAFARLPQMPSYSASKTTVLRYGLRLRRALRKQGVQVSVICPGYVVSPMTDQILGRKPFLMTAEKAADRIVAELARNQAVIAFPRLVAGFLRVAGRLPPPMRDWVLARSKFRVSARA
jgi:short-subunit dehydrogenase